MVAMTHNTTVCAAAVGSAMNSGIASVSSRLGHTAARTVRSITRSATPSGAVVFAPASFAREGRIVEAVEGRWTSTVDEGSTADQRDVVDYGVPLVADTSGSIQITYT